MDKPIVGDVPPARPEIKFEDYTRLAHSMARKAYERLRAAGCHSMTYEDVFQEMALSFVKARAKFDPGRGATFATYYTTAAWTNFNRVAESLIEQNIGHESLDEARSQNDREFHESVADEDTETPEELALLAERRRKKLAAMSPLARRVVEILDAPPKVVLDELKAVRARAKRSRERGVGRMVAPQTLTVRFIMQVMGLSPAQMQEVKRELERAAQ